MRDWHGPSRATLAPLGPAGEARGSCGRTPPRSVVEVRLTDFLLCGSQDAAASPG